MKPHHLTLIAASLLSCGPASWAASFDCTRASTWVERAICNDAGLSGLDERMAEAFNAAGSGQPGAADQGALLGEQRSWLKRRNACRDTGCLRRLYETRIKTLTAAPDVATPTVGGAVAEGRISDTGPGYSVAATYPIFKDPALASVNTAIRAFVQSLTGPFLQDHADETTESAEMGDMPPWSLELGYETPYRTSRYIAIEFRGTDYRGGAHGMPIIEPLVFAAPDGHRIAAKDLFAPGSDWLNVLSDQAYRSLKEDELIAADDDWLKTGTAPQAENYRLIYPGADGLTVTFPPYAVAPYAAGPQSVVIPYARLRGLLNPALFPPSP